MYIYMHVYTCMCVCVRAHTEYYLAIEKNEILPFATTWMDLEGIMLSEVSQRKRSIISYDFTHM